jgi:hypothetical protein
MGQEQAEVIYFEEYLGQDLYIVKLTRSRFLPLYNVEIIEQSTIPM